jgi:hypothetical protein
MRLPYALLGVSIAIFGVALAAPQQPEKTAEQQFKNIKSFKGAKASDVIPAMEFMSASLGVGCDFCHVADRSSDEKRSKGTAREMIAMQRGINEQYFGGRNQVTCASCHNGRTRPVSVPPVAGMEVRARMSSDVKPDDVLEAYGKASGAIQALRLKGLSLQGTSTERGVKSKYAATYLGDKFYTLTRDANGDVERGFNGTVMSFVTPKGKNVIPFEYAESSVRELALFSGPDSLPKLSNTRGATAKIGERDALAVSGTITGETVRATFFFDKQNGLLARATYSYPTILGNIAQVVEYSDYKKVDGGMVPMTVSIHSTNGDSLIHFTSATVDGNVDPIIFEPAK